MAVNPMNEAKRSKLNLMGIIVLLVLTSFSSVIMASDGNDQATKNVYLSEALQIDFVHKEDELFIKTNVKARIMDASLDQAKELIFDLSQITTWLGGVKEATVIKRFSANRQKGVLINQMPFPLDDREVVILLEVASADENHILLKMSSDYLDVPANKKYVRVEPYTAELMLTKDGDDVVFELSDFYNPKVRSVPKFAVVSHLKSISYDTIDKVSKLEFN